MEQVRNDEIKLGFQDSFGVKMTRRTDDWIQIRIPETIRNAKVFYIVDALLTDVFSRDKYLEDVNFWTVTNFELDKGLVDGEGGGWRNIPDEEMEMMEKYPWNKVFGRVHPAGTRWTSDDPGIDLVSGKIVNIRNKKLVIL